MTEKTKEPDVLDKIKAAEKAAKLHVLMKNIGELKRLAKEISSFKEQSRITLEELGISNRDAKRIIDFINELDEVQLTEDEVDNIRDNVKSKIKSQREDYQEKQNESPLTHAFNAIAEDGGGGGGTSFMTTASNEVLLDATGTWSDGIGKINAVQLNNGDSTLSIDV